MIVADITNNNPMVLILSKDSPNELSARVVELENICGEVKIRIKNKTNEVAAKMQAIKLMSPVNPANLRWFLNLNKDIENRILEIINNIRMENVEITKNAANPVLVLLANVDIDLNILFSEKVEINNIINAKNNKVAINNELNFNNLEFSLLPIL